MVEVVPVVIGALGSVTKGFDRRTEKLGIPLNVGVMQETAWLETARILRKVLACVASVSVGFPHKF